MSLPVRPLKNDLHRELQGPTVVTKIAFLDSVYHNDHSIENKQYGEKDILLTGDENILHFHTERFFWYLCK